VKGQWIGRVEKGHSGRIVLNVDEHNDSFNGIAYLTPDDAKLPAVVAVFNTNSKNSPLDFEAFVFAVDPRNQQFVDLESISSIYPNVIMPKSLNATASFDANNITVTMKTDIGQEIEFEINRPEFTAISTWEGVPKSWEEFKEYASNVSKRRYIFRGQKEPWKLRTSFHRNGRYNLRRFINEDAARLHRSLSSKTKHLFDLNIPVQYGAFLNLAQHHGYPTPLLDWTYSPYVAVFFAFRHVPKNTLEEKSVRIFVFDQEQWGKDFNQLTSLDVPTPHLSLSEFLAIDNERVIPQQSVTTVTNIDDIETYIRTKEADRQSKYMWAFDIPWTERSKVMNELSYMGITAGSMFPGIDGVCEELRERMFDE